ncbi:endogenous retrovirus group K member 24 Gag polyprotein-like [Nyctibius grandis]|uniref:endogenous retrovirus group K member 24 Gag polyprotein-like n=1 Tax=Nyctibius grandis TaxID=48427 RepID=UPI0035BC5089
MGGTTTKEESTVLSTWQLVLKQRGISLPDPSLRKMLWGEKHGCDTSATTAFSLTVWEGLGSALFEAATKGDKTAAELLMTWRVMKETVQKVKQQQEKKEKKEDLEPPVLVLSTSVPPPASKNEGTNIPGEEKSKKVMTEESKSVPSVKVKLSIPTTPHAVAEYYKDLLITGTPESVDEGVVQKPQHIKRPTSANPRLPPFSGATPTITEEAAHPSPSAPPADDEELSQALSRLSIKTPQPTPDKLLSLPGITVFPRHPGKFWEAVKSSAALEGEWEVVEKLGGMGGAAGGSGSFSTGPSYPVIFNDPAAGQPHPHVPFSWKVVQDLQRNVARYGVNSPPCMQMLRLLTMETLTPWDFKQLGRIIFQPVQFSVFMSNWRSACETQAVINFQLNQNDPRHGNGMDVLMGEVKFANPSHQAQWDLLILKKIKMLGMNAIVKTAQLASPIHIYTTVRQGPKEPYLSFVERLQEAVEKQVFDVDL